MTLLICKPWNPQQALFAQSERKMSKATCREPGACQQIVMKMVAEQGGAEFLFRTIRSGEA